MLGSIVPAMIKEVTPNALAGELVKPDEAAA
jgi:hypothetical protein